MTKKLNDTCPFRYVHSNCFALLCNGKCFALSDTDFGGKEECPFHKPQHEVDKKVIRRINNINKGVRNSWASLY